ncbi:MAG: hypothetical protein ACE37J_05405 [Pikeienuella sp.]|uniref:hypothetical protein n=1 Tax=Pikeienuella sp. TaxID=2831957 RepID=UPI00391A6A62
MTNEDAGANASVLDEIVSAAARLVRENPVNALTFEAVAEASRLPLGAISALFATPRDIFATILRRRHPLRGRLAVRRGEDAETLWREMEQVFDEYLSPEKLPDVSSIFSLATLIGAVAEAQDPELSAAWAEGFNSILDEMARGQEADPERPEWAAALMHASAAITAAQSAPEERRAAVLAAARAEMSSILAPLAPTPVNRA